MGNQGVNFGRAGAARDFFGPALGGGWKGATPDRNRIDKMAMSQSERIRLIEEAARKTVSRNKCVDSSFLTLINQAKACSGSAVPVRVAAVVNRDDCPTNVVIRGKGTNGEYFGHILQAQNCAICPDTGVVDGGVVPTVQLPTPCPNFAVQPFAQQNISTIYPAPYVAPCKDPGNRTYFPTVPKRGDNCNLEHLPYDS